MDKNLRGEECSDECQLPGFRVSPNPSTFYLLQNTSTYNKFTSFYLLNYGNI